MLKKILCVDDNPTNVAIIEELLADDYSLTTATSGNEALQIASKVQPELVLLDIMMPGMDGYEVCRRLRSLKAHSHMKIIMVSAKAMLSERLKGYESGADDYIVKPFAEEELLAKVRVYLRLRTVEEVDNYKTKILNLLSHKTRTPLSKIISPASVLMAEKEMSLVVRREWGEKIYNNATRLLKYINKALMLNEIKSGTFEFEYNNAFLRNVIQDAISSVSSLATEKNIKLDVDVTETESISFDHKSIKFVLTALLKNSIQFSKSGGIVTVHASNEDDHISLSIADHGEGIDSSYLLFVFDEMYSADVLHHAEGHGISLSIAHEIISRHNGMLNVTSTKGQGATFTIQLPKSQLVSV